MLIVINVFVKNVFALDTRLTCKAVDWNTSVCMFVCNLVSSS